MKKQIGACVLAGSLLAGAAFADPEMKVSVGLKSRLETLSLIG